MRLGGSSNKQEKEKNSDRIIVLDYTTLDYVINDDTSCIGWEVALVYKYGNSDEKWKFAMRIFIDRYTNSIIVQGLPGGPLMPFHYTSLAANAPYNCHEYLAKVLYKYLKECNQEDIS